MDQVPGKKVQLDASAIDVTYCQPCSHDGETVPADAYCTVCKEFMCPGCANFHKKQKMLKSHTLLDKGNMPTTMQCFTTKQESTQPCAIHPEEYIKYIKCPTHQTLNCGHCSVIDHHSCKQQIISEIAKSFKEGQGYEDIKQVIFKLLKDIDACASEVKENSKLIADLGEQEIAKIRNYRDQINKYFDEREQRLIETIAQMKNIIKGISEPMQLKQCDKLKTRVSDIKAKLEAQENNTSQLFIEAHISKGLLEGLQLSLAEIKKTNTIHHYQFKKDTATERILGSKTGLGTIKKITTSKGLDQRCDRSSSISQEKSEKKTTSDAAPNVQADGDEKITVYDATINAKAVCDTQVAQPTKENSANTILEPSMSRSGALKSPKANQKKLTIVNTDLTKLRYYQGPDILVKSPSDAKEVRLSGMIAMPEDRLLLADGNNDIVKLVDLKTYRVRSQVSMPGAPWDICLLPGDRVAVSIGCMGIQLLETHGQLSLGKRIKVDGECYGVGFHNDSFIVSYDGGKIEKINMEGKVLKKVSDSWLYSCPFKKPFYLNVVGEGLTAAIYVSDFFKNTITKLDMDLKIIQTFQDPALIEPRGICSVGNQLLVSGWGSHNIMCLDLPSGKMTQVLGRREETVWQRSFSYSQQQKKMYITLTDNVVYANNYIRVYGTI